MEGAGEVGLGIRLEALAVLAEEVEEVEVEEEEGRGGGGQRMGMRGTPGTVADLGRHGVGRGAKLHAPTRRFLDVPSMGGKARGQKRRCPGWDRK
jgi:hypothetical protein